jgi:hypothetical protein
MLAATTTASLTASQAYVEISIPEFYPPFTLFYVKALPIHTPSNDNTFATLKLRSPFVAINDMHETFIYEPGACHIKKGITICLPHLLNIHRQPLSCAEYLVSPDPISSNRCLSEMQLAQVSTQSFIYTKNTSQVRIFSPFPDAASMRCGADMKSKVIQINNGYTDIAFKSDCVLYTTNLIIYSPFPPQENEKAFVEATVPNLSNIVYLLVTDIFITHKINITHTCRSFSKVGFVWITSRLIQIFCQNLKMQ